ncbi:MAG: hypothetical protein ABFQ62_02795 [Patescibacteria group bacterium]
MVNASPITPSSSNTLNSSLNSKVNASVGTSPGAAPTPVKRNKKLNWKVILGVAALLLLVVGSAAAFFLSRQSQDIRQQAAVTDPGNQETGTGSTVTVECCVNGAVQKITKSSVQSAMEDCAGRKGTVGTCVTPEQKEQVCNPGITKCTKTGDKYIIARCHDSGYYWQFTGKTCNSGLGEDVTGDPVGTEKNPKKIGDGVKCDVNYCTCTPTSKTLRNTQTCTAPPTEYTCYNLNKKCAEVTKDFACKEKDNLFSGQNRCLAKECNDRDGYVWDGGAQKCKVSDGQGGLTNPCPPGTNTIYAPGTSNVLKCECQNNTSKSVPQGSINSRACYDDLTCNSTPKANGCQCTGDTQCSSRNCEYEDPGLSVCRASTCADRLGGQIAYDQAKQICTNSNHLWNDNTCSCGQAGEETKTCPAGSTKIEVQGNVPGDSHLVSKCRCGDADKTLVNPGEKCPSTGITCLDDSADLRPTDTDCTRYCTQSCTEATDGKARCCPSGAGGGRIPEIVDTTGNFCPDNPSLAAQQYVKFTCPNGCEMKNGAWQCFENPVFSENNDMTLDGQCGQIDVMSQAWDWGSYCGYTEYTCDQPECWGGGDGGEVIESFSCNSPCQTNAQCRDTSKGGDARFSCEANRCRLTSNPSSERCQPAVGPQCLNISMINITDPDSNKVELGDEVRFVCGEVAAADHYVFRVFVPGESKAVKLAARTSNKKRSEKYTIDTTGKFFAQCQICTAPGADSCLPWEPVVKTN